MRVLIYINKNILQFVIKLTPINKRIYQKSISIESPG